MQIDAAELKQLLSSTDIAVRMIRHDKDTETVVAFRDGVGLLARRARGWSVDVSDIADQLAGCVVLHNHPTGGAFTVKDAEAAFVCRVAELRVAATRFTYVLRPGSLVWHPDNAAEIRSRCEAHYAAVYREAAWEGFPDIGSEEELSADLRHRMWERVAEYGFVQYNRTEVEP